MNLIEDNSYPKPTFREPPKARNMICYKCPQITCSGTKHTCFTCLGRPGDVKLKYLTYLGTIEELGLTCSDCLGRRVRFGGIQQHMFRVCEILDRYIRNI